MIRTRVRTLTVVGTGSQVTLAQPDVPRAAAHRNSHTSRLRRLEALHERCRKKSSCPTTLFVRSKNSLLSWNEASTKTGLPSRRARGPLAQRPAAQLGRVVLEHVAHVGRLVEHEAVAARRRPRSPRSRRGSRTGAGCRRSSAGRPSPSSSVTSTPPTAARRAAGLRIQPVTSRATSRNSSGTATRK